jgi:dihydroorotate dehydrogenase (fumarate)
VAGTLLVRFRDTISFVTATNTLGSALHLSSPPSLAVDKPPTYQPTLSSAAGTGIGGLAGEAIHYLSLGNVDTLRRGLDAVGLQDVVVIGVGGVGDTEGMRRMLSVGAGAVGVGTALGREGVDVFAKILGQPVVERKLDDDGAVYVDSSV